MGSIHKPDQNCVGVEERRKIYTEKFICYIHFVELDSSFSMQRLFSLSFI